MITLPSPRVTVGAALITLAVTTSAPSGVRPELLEGLVWRNVGPFRAGRVAAVTGVIQQPGVYYVGLPMGGVWKTTSAGVTWFPIVDSVKAGSEEHTPE